MLFGQGYDRDEADLPAERGDRLQVQNLQQRVRHRLDVERACLWAQRLRPALGLIGVHEGVLDAEPRGRGSSDVRPVLSTAIPIRATSA